jgi:hypothetical protein
MKQEEYSKLYRWKVIDRKPNALVKMYTEKIIKLKAKSMKLF